MDPLQLGNAAFLDEDYDRALQLYTEHLKGSPEDATALCNRAAVFLKLSKPREALQDASQATKLKPSYEIAFYRKGLAAFSLSEYEASKHAFERGLALFEAEGKTDTSRKYRTWIRKCDAEIAEEEPVVARDGPTEKKHGSNKENTAVPPPSQKPAPIPTPSPAVAKPSAPTLPPHLAGPVRYQYYQSQTHITVTVLQKGVKEEDANITLEPRRLRVGLKNPSGPEIVVLDKPLYDDVIPAESQNKFFSTKFEIKMKKAQAYEWHDLAGAAGATTAPTEATTASSSSPTSASGGGEKRPRAYASHRDWERVEKEINQELEGEKPEGEEALNNLFRDLYAKGSEETRRAMIKSFQTSGGTVLSTNWGEVKDKDYEKERQAPSGMQWQTWEGDKLPQKDS